MIIGLTIHDNDFQSLIKQFAQRIAGGELILEQPPKEDDPDASEWYHWFINTDRTIRSAVKESNKTTSDTNKSLIKDTILRSWEYFIKNHKDRGYLSGKLEITFPDSIDDTWENGEQLYVFPTSYADNILCF